MLRSAATIELVEDGPTSAILRIVNHTGHKLISGFPEGRRMWLHVEFLAADGSSVGEINPYTPLVTTTDPEGFPIYLSGGDLAVTDERLVYEAKMSSTLTGEEKTFHFVLATDRYKDNRIPPKGFLYNEADSRLIRPRWHGDIATDYFTSSEYSGGYDEVTIVKPPGTAGWKASLHYQTTSKDYVEFLRDEIHGTNPTLSSPTPSGEAEAYIIQTDSFFDDQRGWGDAIWELWLHNQGASPILMAEAISPASSVSVVPGSGHAEIRFPGLPGWSYQVQASETLTEGSWQDVGGEITGAGELITVQDPAAGTLDRRFYRIVSRTAE